MPCQDAGVLCGTVWVCDEIEVDELYRRDYWSAYGRVTWTIDSHVWKIGFVFIVAFRRDIFLLLDT